MASFPKKKATQAELCTAFKEALPLQTFKLAVQFIARL